MDKRRREGWNRERLAKFILGKLSFIAAPDTIGDDYGMDISGFFVREDRDNKNKLVPTLPYAIQIKAKHDRDWVHDHLDALSKSHVPFYYGIVDTKAKTLKVYSMLHLQRLFGEHGLDRVHARVSSGEMLVRTRLARNPYQVDRSKRRAKRKDTSSVAYNLDNVQLTIDLYHICTLNIDSDYRSGETLDWWIDALVYMKTIDSAKAGEYMYYGPDGPYQILSSDGFWWACNRWMQASSLIVDALRIMERLRVTFPYESTFESIASASKHIQTFVEVGEKNKTYDEAINNFIYDVWVENITSRGK